MVKKFLFFVIFYCTIYNAWAINDINATSKTISLYNTLLSNKGKKILLGQHGFYSPVYPTLDCQTYVITGKWPVMLGLDYDSSLHRNRFNINSSQATGNYDQKAIYTQLAKQHYRRGGIISIAWHMNNWVTLGDSKDLTGSPVKNILPGGSSRAAYLSKLDTFAAWCKSFTDDNGNLIPVIFRPFHEGDGGWAWWGFPQCRNDQYVDIFRDIVTYLRDTKGVHNIIYAYCSGAFSSDCYTGTRYPGDDYVDIIGIDAYSNDDDTAATFVYLKRAAQAGQDKDKPVIMFEGYRDQNNYYRPDYWTWLIDQFLSDNLLGQFSVVSFWESTTYGPSASRGDANNYQKLSTDYPQLGWLEDDKVRIVNGTISKGSIGQ